ncbi:folliculin-interacting protein N-terminus-domain-containing protein [Talaromyces proteolyticus]|uniref:Folliculin-interacting protein N-terminus-domain-containing protein n=1 Tax=Talaromyces proteolyticus TaxID=1131652 RepID=A0AAD4PZ73_9EURO|nr:folliculin-interacting protein N-terminus-domain-containing protein [Talaromyces proteolyticus]KAH8696112.1 folliculin-interacting protein N-terminus-domain-containing protein [Talaromyces proteolyticus]
MLGRLLSTFSPSVYAPRNSTVLESVTEEEHTSGLLFPDPRLLHRSSNSAHAFQTSFNSPNAASAGGYDDRGGLELDVIKDFRIIIAQNAIGDRDEPCILLDSKGNSDPSSTHGLGLDPQVFESPTGRHSRTSSLSHTTSRRGSLQTSQPSQTEGGLMSQAANARKIPQVPSGAFGRARCRNSISSMTSPGEGAFEPYHNRTSPESSDSGLLNCIFGSSAFSYKGSSTKMHILSTDSDFGGTMATSPAPREIDALAGRQTPRSALARTYSSTQSSGGYFLDRPQDSKPSSKVTILITRMFSVNLPESRDSTGDSPEVSNSLPPDMMSDNGYPFPDITKRRKIKEKKTPMYAVAITIQIPIASRNNTRPMSRPSTHGPDGSKQMSFSLDSDPHWTSAFFDDNYSQTSLDDRIDLLVDHWDVITRTLTYLENLAGREILTLLKKVDAQVSHGPKPNTPKPLKMPNMQRTNQTIIQLRPNVLAYNSRLKEELLLNAQRISAALRIPRVVLGQSRWGVWREEARWIARLMADKEHGLFFLVLITAFLGNHTDWLSSLGPDWYRKRYHFQQKTQQDFEPTIAHRTVIVSENKMVARRLVFILSAFLPAKHRFDYVNSPMRPGTSASTRPLSQSPPTFPLLRQESLRRKINRRARAQKLHTEEPEVPQRSVSVSSGETAHKNTDEVETSFPIDPPLSSHRRDSDARSIRTANLPIHATEARTRATTSTTTNSSAIPVPHFASRRRQLRDDSDRTGVDGSDSYASAKLLQNLRRSETNNSDGSTSTGGSKWVGNIWSGLWSGRPDSSRGSDGDPSSRRPSMTQTPENDAQSEDNNAEGTKTPLTINTSPKGAQSAPSTDTISIAHSSATAKNIIDQDESEFAPTDQVKDSPLRLSVRGDDGVVDVDLPLRGFLSLSSSNDSTLASPKKARTSITSMDAGGSMQSSFSNINSSLKDNDSPALNVSGWLKSIHEDFILQAVRPYHGIEADVKRAMLAESFQHIPVPGHDAEIASVTDRWVEVASTLIADTRTCTVKRIRLLRKISANGLANPPSPAVGATSRQVVDTPSTNPLTGFFNNGRSRKDSVATLAETFDPEEIETKFVDEPVMDVDGTLVDAIERVLIQSGQSSLAHSRAPSPHRTIRLDERPTDDTPHIVEVPRSECRKTVLGALEEVARNVAEEHCREEGDVDFGIDSTDKNGKRQPIRQENTLREGVRKWLLDIEEAL